MKAHIEKYLGGSPDPRSTSGEQASDHCSQGSNVPSTPIPGKRLFQAWIVEPATPSTKRQCVLPFAVTPRSTPSSQDAPSTPASQATPESDAKRLAPKDEVFVGPALQQLMRSARTHPEHAGLIQKVSYWEKEITN